MTTYAPMAIEPQSMIAQGSEVIREIYIRKLIIRETGTYNNQFTRSYKAHLSPQSVNALTDRIASNGGVRQVRPAFLSGTASNMISISAAPESNTPINIAGGWANKRLLFFMDVLTVSIGGMQTAYHVQGYTDYVGLSLQSKAFDPEMLFYMNNMMVVRVMGPNTQMAGSPLVSADHILFTPQTDIFNQDGVSKWTMRPEDVFKTLSLTSSLNTADPNNPPTVLDQRNKLTTTPKMSKRSNAISTNYASTVLNSFLNSTHETGEYVALNDTYENAVNYAADNVSATNPFLNALSRRSVSGMISGMFKWKDLLQIDPNILNVTTVMASGPTQVKQQHVAGSTANWDGATIETKYAATISQAVPALMMENMLYRVAFSVNNTMGFEAGSPTGIYTVITNAMNMSGQPVIREIENFKRRLEIEVLKDISFNNEQKFDIRVMASVFGDTWLSISIDGGPSYDFVTPTFCDGIITPVLTSHYENIHSLASSMDVLATQVYDAREPDPVGSNITIPHVGDMHSGGSTFNLL